MHMRSRKESPIEHILDDEEQDQIVKTLSLQNQQHGHSFSNIIAALCLVPTVAIAALTTTRNIAISFLSISSLAITAFTLKFLPSDSGDELNGPLAQYLPMLNGVLAITITCIQYLRSSPGFTAVELLTSLHTLPLFMYLISTLLRISIATTTRQIAILEDSKYKLKGA